MRKRQGVVTYTVQVDTGGDGESAVLKECASGTDKFYRITDPGETLTVFNPIGQSLARLRVANTTARKRPRYRLEKSPAVTAGLFIRDQ